MIKSIKAKEILNSRGEPTVEVELKTNYGAFQASVPSGASKGKYEAQELRDGGERYQGKGVLMATRNVNEIIAKALEGKDEKKQKEIDQALIELDGTKNKSKLGANAVLPVSIAVCRAGAVAQKIPLWKYIAQLIENSRPVLPKPAFNIINGGAHAKNELDIQEFMIVPQAKTFKENLQIAFEVYRHLGEILQEKYGLEAKNLGDEGGFAPPISQTKEAIDFIMQAAKSAGNQEEIKIGLDCAASQLFKKENYELEKTIFTKDGLLEFYQNLVEKYPILFIEDPFSEEDWEGFQKTNKELGKSVDIIGDDLLTTNKDRIKTAKAKEACNGMILKPNQIGTVTETLEAALLAKSYGWKIMISHRSGETKDVFIADLAVGISADLIKSGSPSKEERMAKYNRLLEIEEEIKKENI